jgi:hypothetical protein
VTATGIVAFPASSSGMQSAGSHEEVWVDFAWLGENEGDFFHPFSTIEGAVNIVAEWGTIKIVPGVTTERPSIHRNNKRFRLVAPMGGRVRSSEGNLTEATI